MTPKEKAEELVEKMSIDWDMCRGQNIQCALVAVDEIILSIIQIHNGMTWSERRQTTERNTGYAYWQDVKREIEKL
jgi:hypothetical protein